MNGIYAIDLALQARGSERWPHNLFTFTGKSIGGGTLIAVNSPFRAEAILSSSYSIYHIVGMFPLPRPLFLHEDSMDKLSEVLKVLFLSLPTSAVASLTSLRPYFPPL